MRGSAQRAFNSVAGTLMWLGGLGLLGSGIFVALTEAPAAPHPVANEAEIDPASCTAVLASLGLGTTHDAKTGTIKATGWLGDISALDNMTRISLGISACKLPLRSFCYKNGCLTDSSGFELVLGGKPEKPGAAPAPRSAPKPSAVAPATPNA